MDSTEKLKSLNGVSIVWIEECSEISFDAYMEVLGRIRTADNDMYFILTCNPVSKFNWVYQTFFEKNNNDGGVTTILDPQTFYEKKIVVHDGIYYHHSTCDDNPFLPGDYINRLDTIKDYDYALWIVARLGKFGATGTRVLPQFEVKPAAEVMKAVNLIPPQWHRAGMDFGFEVSYNCVVRVAVDPKKKYLYIYDEYYRNKMTDDKTAEALVKWNPEIKTICIKADNAEPKTIKYYRQQGFYMLPCRKKADKKSEGSRIANTKKVKRFVKIICSSKCISCIRELKDLSYKKNKDGSVDFSKFNIDSHTFKTCILLAS